MGENKEDSASEAEYEPAAMNQVGHVDDGVLEDGNEEDLEEEQQRKKDKKERKKERKKKKKEKRKRDKDGKRKSSKKKKKKPRKRKKMASDEENDENGKSKRKRRKLNKNADGGDDEDSFFNDMDTDNENEEDDKDNVNEEMKSNQVMNTPQIQRFQSMDLGEKENENIMNAISEHEQIENGKEEADEDEIVIPKSKKSKRPRFVDSDSD